MTPPTRESIHGRILSREMTSEDALFYRGRIDELHGISASLIDHYGLGLKDYDGLIAISAPTSTDRKEQSTLLLYVDGLVTVLNTFVLADIEDLGASKDFFNSFRPRLSSELNYPPRFRSAANDNQLALAAAH